MDAGIYVRISADKEGKALGVKRQEEDCRALAAQRGWSVVEVYRDNDISAVKLRPEWDRMLSDIAGGRLGALLAYSSSRLYRDVDGEKARLFNACLEQDHNGSRVQIETVVSGAINPYTADGRMIANIYASVDAAERERIGERVSRKLREKRERGEWAGRAPYGWRLVDKKLAPYEPEQRVILDAALRYIDGKPFNHIAASITMPTGRAMQTLVLQRILTSARVLEALPQDVSTALSEAVLARKGADRPNTAKSLLGGIVRCGICGAGLRRGYTRAGRDNGTKYYQYRCLAKGHVGCGADWLDEFVTEQVISAIDIDKLLAQRKRQPANARRVSKIEGLLDHLNARYVEGKVRPEDFDRMSVKLLEQLNDAQSSERNGGVDLPAELARGLEDKWPTFSVETQRRIISAVVTTIKLGRGKPKDPSRVEITWRS